MAESLAGPVTRLRNAIVHGDIHGEKAEEIEFLLHLREENCISRLTHALDKRQKLKIWLNLFCAFGALAWIAGAAAAWTIGKPVSIAFFLSGLPIIAAFLLSEWIWRNSQSVGDFVEDELTDYHSLQTLALAAEKVKHQDRPRVLKQIRSILKIHQASLNSLLLESDWNALAPLVRFDDAETSELILISATGSQTKALTRRANNILRKCQMEESSLFRAAQSYLASTITSTKI